MPFGNDKWRNHEMYRYSTKSAWPGFRIGVGLFFVAWGVETAYNFINKKPGDHGHGSDHGHGHDSHH
eukprot:1394279-Amorphochlora_amoeboformis.AAC.2